MSYRGSGGSSPFGGFPLFSLRREIDRIFEDAVGGRRSEQSWTPAVNVREGERELTLDFELPGIRPEQVEISFENGVLTVTGEKQEERKEGDEGGRYHLIERSYGTFARSFQLPPGIDETSIEAEFENGVLHVRIPKAALPQPRKFQIRGTSSGSTGTATGGAGRAKPGSGGQQGGAKGGGASNRGAISDEREVERNRAASRRTGDNIPQ